jgi:hypothetical protein
VWDYGFRTTPSLFISEKPAVAGGTASQLYLDISSSVVYGDNPSEISILPVSKGYSGNYLFDHCLLRLDTNKSGFWSRDRFHSVKVNENPRFIDHISWDFRPDTLSPLIDMGNPLYLIDFPIDIRGASRSADGHPDAGAYERIPGEKRKPN